MYKDFIKKILLFSKSIVFKLDILPDMINTNLVNNGYSIDYYDKSTWKYYLNISGEKHISNKSVIIKLIETGEEVELTKSLFETYKYTKQELLKFESYYDELVTKYPTEIDYIKGCLNPVDINLAIDAEEGKVLSYNSYFLETNETNIISQLEEYLVKILYRWKIDAYAKYEDLYPASNLVCTASTTTMASSTTVPIANTRANSVRILILKPAIIRQAKVPTNDTIIDIDGINVLLKSCKKKYTTRITRSIASIKVSTTLSIEAKRKSLELIILTNSTPLGRSFSISFISSDIDLFTSVALVPGVWFAINITAGLPSILLLKL